MNSWSCTQSTGVDQTKNSREEALFVNRRIAKLGLVEDPMEESRIEERVHDLHRMNTI